MKSTLKNTFKILGCVAGAALLFSCTNPAAGTGAGGTVTGASGTVTGASGVTFSTVYTEPTLPANVGTDPFKGHTYRMSTSSSSFSNQTDYEFGNNGELSQISTFTSGSNEVKNGYKYAYTYIADAKELNLKVTHCYLKINNEYKYLTYAETINYLVNLTTAQVIETMNGGNSLTDAQAKEMIEKQCRNIKQQFETSGIWKAELNSSNNLVLRLYYYKTAPSALPNNMSHMFTSSGTSTNSLSLTINQEGSTGGKGGLSTSIISGTGSSSTRTAKLFNITTITSNAITAVESTSTATGYTPVSGGTTLQMGYTLALGNDNNLVITLTGSDDTTKNYFNTFLGTTAANPTITASTNTGTSMYNLVQ